MKNERTDENVIPFRTRLRAEPAQPTEEQRAALIQKQREQTSAKTRRQIRAKFEKRSMVQSKQERIRLANNLWKILEDVRPFVSTKAVLHAAGHVKHSTDSTKRLPYFALDPNLPDSVREKRAEKLAKHIEAYAKIATQAAQLSGKDELSLIQQLVDGTYYVPLREDIDDANFDISADVWADVQTALQLATTRISSKYNLPRFFKLVHDLGVGTDRRAGRCDTKKLSLPAWVDTERLPLRPSVHLGEIRVCDDIPCTISPFMYEPGEDEEKEHELFVRLRDTGPLFESFKAVAAPVLRARLELLPLGREYIVTPILRLDSWTYVAFAEDFTGFAAFGGSEWRAQEIVDGFRGSIKEIEGTEWSDLHLAAADAESETSAYVEMLAKFESDVGTAYANSLHFESSDVSSRILRFDDSARILLSKQMFIPPDCEDEETKRGLWCSDLEPNFGDTIAALLERSLFPEAARLDHLLAEKAREGRKGAVARIRETVRLDHLLDEKARILTQELDEMIEKARARRHERLDELRRE
jgi:hypothetical protein